MTIYNLILFHCSDWNDFMFCKVYKLDVFSQIVTGHKINTDLLGTTPTPTEFWNISGMNGVPMVIDIWAIISILGLLPSDELSDMRSEVWCCWMVVTMIPLCANTIICNDTVTIYIHTTSLYSYRHLRMQWQWHFYRPDQVSKESSMNKREDRRLILCKCVCCIINNDLNG